MHLRVRCLGGHRSDSLLEVCSQRLADDIRSTNVPYCRFAVLRHAAGPMRDYFRTRPSQYPGTPRGYNSSTLRFPQLAYMPRYMSARGAAEPTEPLPAYDAKGGPPVYSEAMEMTPMPQPQLESPPEGVESGSTSAARQHSGQHDTVQRDSARPNPELPDAGRRDEEQDITDQRVVSSGRHTSEFDRTAGERRTQSPRPHHNIEPVQVAALAAVLPPL